MSPREEEQKLLELILDVYDCSERSLVDHLLSWMNSDDSTEALKDFCRDNDIPYESEE